jgi:fructose transport system ATP-binding protein
MRKEAAEHMASLKIGLRSMRQPVENLSGGQRQGVAVARAVSWGKRVVIMDEPTAALGVKESGMVLELIRNVKARGVPVILISHNLPHVFEIADRIQVMRLGRRAGIARPGEQSMDGVVAMMTGATQAELATAVAAADQTASQAEPA